VSGMINFKDIKEGDKYTTLNGKVLLAHEKDGKVNIDGISILAREAKISNGVMHMADTVIQ